VRNTGVFLKSTSAVLFFKALDFLPLTSFSRRTDSFLFFFFFFFFLIERGVEEEGHLPFPPTHAREGVPLSLFPNYCLMRVSFSVHRNQVDSFSFGARLCFSENEVGRLVPPVRES